MFVTAIYAVLSPEKGELMWLITGLNPDTHGPKRALSTQYAFPSLTTSTVPSLSVR